MSILSYMGELKISSESTELLDHIHYVCSEYTDLTYSADS